MRSPGLFGNSGRSPATKNESHSPLATLALICVVVAVCFDSQTARANAGPPIREGQLLAEPIGIRDVHITHEL